MLLMSYSYASNNNNYQTELDRFSSNPEMQRMLARQCKIYGSIDAVYRLAFTNTSSNNASRSNYNSGEYSPSVGSSGKYMTHCYYGCQPGDKITTVIG